MNQSKSNGFHIISRIVFHSLLTPTSNLLPLQLFALVSVLRHGAVLLRTHKMLVVLRTCQHWMELQGYLPPRRSPRLYFAISVALIIGRLSMILPMVTHKTNRIYTHNKSIQIIFPSLSTYLCPKLMSPNVCRRFRAPSTYCRA